MPVILLLTSLTSSCENLSAGCLLCQALPVFRLCRACSHSSGTYNTPIHTALGVFNFLQHASKRLGDTRVSWLVLCCVMSERLLTGVQCFAYAFSFDESEYKNESWDRPSCFLIICTSSSSILINVELVTFTPEHLPSGYSLRSLIRSRYPKYSRSGSRGSRLGLLLCSIR